MVRRPTVFHEPWWLDAAAGTRWQDIRTEASSGQFAYMPVFRTRKLGFPMLGMPPLTRTLGPHFEGLEGKPETRRRKQQALLDEIIRNLPEHVIFNQVLEPSPNNDGLAWRLNGFTVNVEYTFRLEDCSNIAGILANVRDTTRRVIRRAEETLSVDVNAMDVTEFIDFYFRNLAIRGRSPLFDRPAYHRVVEAALCNGAGEILSTRDTGGRLLASICTVFDSATTYYLLTTQDRSIKDNGCVGFLIWNAIKRASERGHAFDFDGFGDRGTATFLSQFGGVLCPRLRVSRVPRFLQSLVHLGPRF